LLLPLLYLFVFLFSPLLPYIQWGFFLLLQILAVSWTFFVCVYYRDLNTLPIAILTTPFLALYFGVFFRYAPSSASRWDMARQLAIALMFSVGVDTILVISFSATPAGQQAKLQATGTFAAICNTVL
jgi:hypothetical protein